MAPSIYRLLGWSQAIRRLSASCFTGLLHAIGKLFADFSQVFREDATWFHACVAHLLQARNDKPTGQKHFRSIGAVGASRSDSYVRSIEFAAFSEHLRGLFLLVANFDHEGDGGSDAL